MWTQLLPCLFLVASVQVDAHDGVAEEDSYLDVIFDQYAVNGKLSFSGFQELAENLGLDEAHVDHTAHDQEVDHEHSHTIFNAETYNDIHWANMEKNRNAGTHHEHLHENQRKCISSTELWENHGYSEDSEVTKEDLLSLLPALVYQLDQSLTMCFVVAAEDHDLHAVHSQNAETEVWLYAVVAVVVISLCGVCGVAVIPIMHKTVYHHMLQFLVALAVGSLSGDALLHLLPHAMLGPHSHGSEHHTNGGSHDNHDTEHHGTHGDAERETVLKGLAALVGFFFFFVIEKLIAVLAECRNSRKEKSPVLEMRNRSERMVGKKLSKHHQYTTYSYNLEDVGLTPKQADQESCSQVPSEHYHNCYEKNEENGECQMPNECKSPNKSEKINFPDPERSHVDHSHEPLMAGDKGGDRSNRRADISPVFGKKATENSSMNNTLKPPGMMDDESEEEEDDIPNIIITRHENMHHGHSHAHGHVHSRPATVVAVAWMVIMGDGIHNLTDGLIIGAAFASSITGGLSTSIAVFCHELPHEVGDFAVLLKTGMSWKQALFYNGVSSILCFFGMILGVLLGRMDNVEPWVFACAAGMFLYIALVDMIPELNHLPPGVRMGQGSQLTLQCAGMMLGGGIMLAIAFNEHTLKNLFNE